MAKLDHGSDSMTDKPGSSSAVKQDPESPSRNRLKAKKSETKPSNEIFDGGLLCCR